MLFLSDTVKWSIPKGQGNEDAQISHIWRLLQDWFMQWLKSIFPKEE